MSSRYFGFNMPFIGGHQKIMSRQEDDKLIKNDILNNLLIVPGELPFRPSFGVNLRNFVFQKITDDQLIDLEQEIRLQILSNDPRLIIRTLSVVPDADQGGLQITLIVSLIEDPDQNIEIKRLIRVLTGNKQ